MRSTDNPIY